MSILIDEKTRVIVQGYTGDKATFHAKEMIAYGTNVDAGRRILAESGLPLISADTLQEAAEKAVTVAQRPRAVA